MADKLYAAAKRGDLAGVKRRATKENLNDHHGEFGATPLHYAAMLDHLEVVKWLVGEGANIEAPDEDGATPLHWAAIEDHLEVVKWLAGEGANMEALDNNGATPLHYAAGNDHLEVVKWLAGEGANIEALDNDGRTPLMVAAAFDRVETVQLLVLLGANTAATNSAGRTALDIARRKNYHKVVDVLTGASSLPTVNLSMQNVEERPATRKQRRTFSRTKCMNMMTAGQQRHGKTSFVRTLIHSRPNLTEDSDRTVVANFSLWVPRGKKARTIAVIDLGGHESYQVTGHYFHLNTSHNVVVLCHDLTVDDSDATMGWLDSILTTSPSTHIEILLTKADKVREDQRQQKREEFMQKLGHFVKKQLKILRGNINFAKKHDVKAEQVTMLEIMQEKYEELLTNMDMYTHIISCVEEESMNEMRECLIKLSERPENVIHLKEEHHLLYEALGRVGLNVPQIYFHDKDQPSGTKTPTTKKTSTAKKATPFRRLKEFFGKQKASSPSGVSEKPSMEEHTQIATLAEDVEEHTQYATLAEAVKIYKAILEELGLSREAVEDQTKAALAQLSADGLLIYFKENEKLEQIIFNNLKTFVNILKVVFHHAADEHMNPEDELVDKHYAGYNSERRFKEDVDRLKQEGLMTNTLLGFLLEKHNCGVDTPTVMELLDKVDVGYKFIPEGAKDDEPVVFIPFFISQKDVNEVDIKMFQNIGQSEEGFLSVTMSLTGNMKNSYWHYLMVRFFQRVYVQGSTQVHQIFNNGLYVTMGKHDAMIALTRPEKDRIEFTIKCSVACAEGHDFIFSTINQFSEDSDEGMTKWWRGMPRKKIVKCSHCGLEIVIHPGQWELTEWSAEEVFACGAENQRHVFCQKKWKIPSGFVHPLSKNDPQRRYQLEDLQQWLANYSRIVKTLDVPVEPKKQATLDVPLDEPETCVQILRPKQAVMATEMPKLYRQGYFFPVGVVKEKYRGETPGTSSTESTSTKQNPPTHPTPVIPGTSRTQSTSTRQNQPTHPTPVIPEHVEIHPIKDLKVNTSNRIAQGRFGSVYSHKLLGTDMAVKEIQIETKDKTLPSHMHNELIVSNSIAHPSVVQFIGYKLHTNTLFPALYLVYELLEGHTLAEIIHDDELNQQYQFGSSKRKYSVMLQISQALCYLHHHKSAITHGDLNPANVMVTVHGIAKLFDFGASKINEGETDGESAGQGTPLYMAPEQLLEGKPSSVKTDVYAFGSTMYEVLSRQTMWGIEESHSEQQMDPNNGESEGIGKLKQKMSTERIPHRVRDMDKQPAKDLITRCVQFEDDRRLTAKEVVGCLKRLHQNVNV